MHSDIEPLTFLHITGSSYLILLAFYSNLVQHFGPILFFYIISSIIGFLVAWMLIQRNRDQLTWFLSFSATLGGAIATVSFFLLAPYLVDPFWIIFLIMGYRLYQKREKFSRRRLKRKIRSTTLILLLAISLVGVPLSYVMYLSGGQIEWAEGTTYLIQIGWVGAITYLIIVIFGAFLLKK